MAQRSQALAFGEILAGGVLVTSAITGSSIADVLTGKASSIRPLVSASPTGQTEQGSAAGSGSGSAGGGPMPTPGGAVNPLPGWRKGRIDMGVDASPPHQGASILAPLDAVVEKIGAPGWPYGRGVLLRLSNGQHWYSYEGLRETVHAGQRVHAGQQIAVAAGSSIEVGFADANGVPLSHASYTEGKVTNWGNRAAAFLSELGFH